MTIERHGLAIGLERSDDHVFLCLKAQGKLTHKDYEMITPMINSALNELKAPKINALIDGAELQGWEARALWDDFKLGLKHGNEFEKIAIYGNKNWLKMSAKIGNWFMSGEIKYFEDFQEAITWLKA